MFTKQRQRHRDAIRIFRADNLADITVLQREIMLLKIILSDFAGAICRHLRIRQKYGKSTVNIIAVNGRKASIIR